ncbi:MAG: hypothetical protein ACD_52C00004G0003 [uncultured bacterium]|uniref:Uncharacterized protein n=1 Tax=Candidatus Woesebacteria bacterium RIFCSPHIGHO2_12_FULL_41_24 TaxID=1802510 RepID=A0A1F8ARR2_9BACT|nr:MAG: hypothetical protein ACD_52C00004G0003 [uncultured bacterium]OGM13365.1 MAG: hypothetical protein A2W15_05700 [Candidatus Woesebacteria bacterium RBG_16_41_13]OGM30939.1 MAG: hypothetical protein A2873_04015 [Candidatus Woesebacteria bacterium RIFCSPHIGHO2_01_FULL_42_80]OGM35908.1 MAG: hypothetical protein A3D84_01485 [Candidatus Woesebacteria bacterium RIFCSPHIGHO2_02_FULL_42_20]OGM54199.1 MAG: hypothetical protein A3E44_00770 [Candidatus Woesebacteria bacterium RIFCSPHIGHO2_12_FULL_41
MKELLSFIVKNITASDAFTIDENVDGSKHIYIIRVKPELFGIVIGKEGRTIKSIRNLAKVRAVVENKSISVEVDNL